MECSSSLQLTEEENFMSNLNRFAFNSGYPPDDKACSSKRKYSMEIDQLSPGKRYREAPTRASQSTDCDMADETVGEVSYMAWIRQFESMNKDCQNSAIASLIATLSLQQAGQVRRLVEPFFQRDFLAETPPEVGLKILNYLKPADLVHASAVSHYWRDMCEDVVMWRKICIQLNLCGKNTTSESPPVECAPTSRSEGGWKESALSHRSLLISHDDEKEYIETQRMRGHHCGTVYERCSWKSFYLRWRRILSNWKQKKIGGSCVLRGHEDNVITCLQVFGDYVVTGSDDHTLRVWSISGGMIRHSLIGHHGGVWTAQIDYTGRFVVSGSTDRTVKVWSMETGDCLHTMMGHTSTVRCLAIHGNVAVSGSRDATLRSWSIENGTMLRHFVGHLAAVRCVQFDGERIVSGAYDFAVKVWNPRDGSCIHTLQGHTNRVYSLVLDSERRVVVSGSLDTTIRVWNIDTGECTIVLIGHTSLTSGMQILGHLLISCNADSTIRVWDIRDGTCLHRLAGANGHGSAITSLQLVRDGLIVTSSDDGSVKLWDVYKGLFVRDLLRLRTCGNGGCVWRLKATENLLVCAVGSRNGTEETKLVLFDFDASYP